MHKLINSLKITGVLLLAVSCNLNDDGPESPQITGNYFPLTLDNYWNYDVENRNVGLNQTQTSRDSVYVAAANNNAFDLATNAIAKGTMNTILTQTSLIRTASTLRATGSVTFPFDGLDDLQIPFTEALFYDLNASPNSIISEVEGVLAQDVDNLSIETTYNLQTTQGEFAETLILNSDTYTDVTKSSMVLNLAMTTTVEVIPGNFVEVSILTPQTVLKITNYYAKNMGLVRSEADITYQLEDFSSIGITLPFTTDLNATSVQELDTYVVAEE